MNLGTPAICCSWIQQNFRYLLSRASISAKLSPVSLWILLTQDLAEFSTLGVPKGSCPSPCRLRAALRMLDQLWWVWLRIVPTLSGMVPP